MSSQLSSCHITELGLNFSYIVLHAPDYVEIYELRWSSFRELAHTWPIASKLGIYSLW